MGAPQSLTTETGEELVVLSRRDYDALLARSGDPGAEDRMTERLVAELKGGEEKPLAAEAWAKIEAGDNPIRVVRTARGLTQVQLAESAGITQAYVAGLERAESPKSASPRTLAALARALQIPSEVLTGED